MIGTSNLNCYLYKGCLALLIGTYNILYREKKKLHNGKVVELHDLRQV